MRGQAGFWDIDERYALLSESGDPLEKLNRAVPWEVFRKPPMDSDHSAAQEARGLAKPYLTLVKVPKPG